MRDQEIAIAAEQARQLVAAAIDAKNQRMATSIASKLGITVEQVFQFFKPADSDGHAQGCALVVQLGGVDVIMSQLNDDETEWLQDF